MLLSRRYKPEFSKLLSIAIPISLSQFGHVMVGFVDCVLAGNIGKQELAVATISNAIFFPLLTFIIGVTSGITPLAAFQYGKSDVSAMKKLFHHSLLINLFITIGMYISMLFVGQYIIGQFSEHHIYAATWHFYSLFLISLIPIVAFQTFKQYAEAIGHTRLASVITIAGNILNIILSLFLVKSMGLSGIAWATLLSRCAMALVYIISFQFDNNLAQYKYSIKKDFTHFSSVTIIEMLKTSIPYGLQMLVEAAAFGMAGLLALKIGIIEGGGHQIALQIASVVYMISTGLGAASTVCIGQERGKGAVNALKRTASITIILMLVYNVLTALVLLLFKVQLSSMFTTDNEILILSSHLLLFAASFQFFDGLQVAFMGILRGLNDTFIPTILVGSAYWLVALPLGYLMAFKCNMGVDGIWYALVLGLFLVSVALYIRMKLILKIKMTA
jgi:multidrug resistance protein, MATE family